jgi:hypothetical protein
MVPVRHGKLDLSEQAGAPSRRAHDIRDRSPRVGMDEEQPELAPKLRALLQPQPLAGVGAHDVRRTDPALTHRNLLMLQRVAGNLAVSKLLGHRVVPALAVQRCGATPCECPEDEKMANAQQSPQHNENAPVQRQSNAQSAEPGAIRATLPYAPGEALRAGALVALQRQAGNPAVVGLLHVQQLEVQRATGDKDCPGYSRGEIAQSRTPEGILTSDVILRGPGYLLVADFGVDRRSVKEQTKRHPALRHWRADFEQNHDYRLAILGLDDCVGSPLAREQLRRGRAEQVRDLLGPDARTRVEVADAAPVTEYTADNLSSGGRAMNWGVLISFRQEVEGEPVEVRAKPPPKSPDAKTQDCGVGNNTKHPASEVQDAHQRAAAMLEYAVTRSSKWVVTG